MRRNLRPENLGDLLMQPRVAILATRGRDDNTLLSAVWQEWTDGGFTVVTFIGDVKLRHVQQEPAASIIVAEDAPPYRGIEVRAEARVVSGDADAALRRLAGRYLGPDKVDAYMEKIGPALLALIRMEPWQTAGLGLRGRSMVKAFSSRPWRYAETALRGRPLYCF